jgi:RNA polymerase sigma-70 factor (ECF subfamily)
MNVETAADEELIRQFAQGDGAALGVLFSRYKLKIIEFIVWTTPEHKDRAEDIMQEVFMKVCRNPGAFRGKSRFKSWLYGVARLTALDWRRNFFRSIAAKVSVRIDSERQMDEIPEIAPQQIERLIRLEDSNKVHEAVSRLPDKLKAVLLLREWEELDYGGISDILGIPVGTVRSRLHNARALLAAYLSVE